MASTLSYSNGSSASPDFDRFLVQLFGLNFAPSSTASCSSSGSAAFLAGEMSGCVHFYRIHCARRGLANYHAR